ncbi:hypothetical protein E4T42_03857 [Aureobasidium subglaciale]|nr:hypothetical protein E4T42_03857 [Aureobasidium subglaciale]
MSPMALDVLNWTLQMDLQNMKSTSSHCNASLTLLFSYIIFNILTNPTTKSNSVSYNLYPKMRFSTIAAPVMALFATSAYAGVMKRDATSDLLIQQLSELTQMSKTFTPQISAIKAGGLIAKRQSNPFQYNVLICLVTPIIDDFRAFIEKETADIQTVGSMPPVSDETAQKQVCSAYSTFVQAHQELLKVVIGKSGLLEGIFLGPVAAVLRSHEGALDTVSFITIDSVASCAEAVTSQKSSLDDTLGKAICAYTPGGSLGLDLFCKNAVTWSSRCMYGRDAELCHNPIVYIQTACTVCYADEYNVFKYFKCRIRK